MLGALLLFAQAAAAMPDIHFNATVDIRSVKIEKKGAATLTVRADPDAGSVVNVEAPKANGAKTLSNVRVTLDAQARIGASPSGAAQIRSSQPDATETEQPR